MREMDDDHIKSDNADTQLYLKVNLRVVTTVYPRVMTVLQLLHDKPNTDGLMANLAVAVMNLITIPRSSCKDSTTGCSPHLRTLSCDSSQQWPASRASQSNVLPTPSPSSTTCLDVQPLAVPRQLLLRYDAVVSALGTNDPTVVETAVAVLAALAGPAFLSPHAPSSTPCSTRLSPCGRSPSSRRSPRRSSCATT